MKNTTKQFNTHFNFAILAIITVGFLLWHSIAIFNLEQELQSLQSNTAISKKASIQKDDTQGTETENTDTEILYNEDGSIDTSNWKTYTNEEYGFSVKYPEGWEIDNMMSMGIATDGMDCNFMPRSKECDVLTVAMHPDKNETSINVVTIAFFGKGHEDKYRIESMMQDERVEYTNDQVPYKTNALLDELFDACRVIASLDADSHYVVFGTFYHRVNESVEVNACETIDVSLFKTIINNFKLDK